MDEPVRMQYGVESMQALLARSPIVGTLTQRLLEHPEAQVRIRPGQRKLIFATAGRLGLRDEQLHDLIEGVSDQRTRAISKLTIGEARRLIGLLKTMERKSAQLVAEGQAACAP